VVPLIRHVFGIEPDAPNKTIVFHPHLPIGWEDMSIEDLPVGTTLISFSRARTERGIEYAINAKEDGWKFLLRGIEASRARFLLNGRPVSLTAEGLSLQGRKNRLLVIAE
jgi:hypothetical protein